MQHGAVPLPRRVAGNEGISRMLGGLEESAAKPPDLSNIVVCLRREPSSLQLETSTHSYL